MVFQSYRTKYNGVPILQKTEIDEIAEKYVQDFDPDALKEEKQVDIDSFTQNYLGLKQDFQYLSHNGVYLGMMVFKSTDRIPVYVPETNTAEYISAEGGTVIIDSRLLEEGQEHRYRYTMGHECAHHIFHKAYFLNAPRAKPPEQRIPEPMIQCRVLPSGGKVKPISKWDDLDSMEWQANYFSSAILMPKSMVFKLLHGAQEFCPILGNNDFISLVSGTFNVSWHAAKNRLRSLELLKAGVEVPSAMSDFARRN